jgi:phosphoribosylformylglycinamidine cyclo-ligase
VSFSIDHQSWVVPPLFAWLQRGGGIEDREMFRAFNMGVGLVLVVSTDVVGELLRELPEAWVIGHVVGC